jgi:hypothetical protein
MSWLKTWNLFLCNQKLSNFIQNQPKVVKNQKLDFTPGPFEAVANSERWSPGQSFDVISAGRRFSGEVSWRNCGKVARRNGRSSEGRKCRSAKQGMRFTKSDQRHSKILNADLLSPDIRKLESNSQF